MGKGKKKEYESPSTKKTLVELEEGVCAASITDDKNKGVHVESTPQDYEEIGNDGITWDEQK